VLAGMLSKLSVDPSSGDFINPLAPCMPIFLDPTTRSQLLREMPMLDDIDITAWQTGDLSYPVPRNRERSLHTCAQDVQITRMATI
jgi:hypothetical protein